MVGRKEVEEEEEEKKNIEVKGIKILSFFYFKRVALFFDRSLF
jgi:hypothetical protein